MSVKYNRETATGNSWEILKLQIKIDILQGAKL